MNMNMKLIEARNGAGRLITASSLRVMMLAAAKGTQLDLVVEGPDEQEAVEKLCELIANRFDEEC